MSETVEAMAALTGESEATCLLGLTDEPQLLFQLPAQRHPTLSWRSRDIGELPMELQNAIAFAVRSKYST